MASTSGPDTATAPRRDDAAFKARREKLALGTVKRGARKTDKGRKNQARITVVLRKRPLNANEVARKETDILEVDDTKTLATLCEPRKNLHGSLYIETHQFTFDRVYPESTSNLEVYQSCVQPLVNRVFSEGAACSCFAYGQTGSGKTYTMVGPFRLTQKNEKASTRGIWELAGVDIFEWLHRPHFDYVYGLYVSFYEIYCNKVYDLLNDRKWLRALESKSSDVVVKDLTVVKVDDLETLLKYMLIGMEKRVTGSNSKNSESSRGHAIVSLEIRKVLDNQLHGKLAFVDLAGSERGADSMSAGRQTQSDGASINQSLLNLKECIRSMDSQKSYIPFRNSQLARMLKDMFISEKARTLMVANVSPASGCSEQTLNTIRYADLVTQMRKLCKPDIAELPERPVEAEEPEGEEGEGEYVDFGDDDDEDDDEDEYDSESKSDSDDDDEDSDEGSDSDDEGERTGEEESSEGANLRPTGGARLQHKARARRFDDGDKDSSSDSSSGSSSSSSESSEESQPQAQGAQRPGMRQTAQKSSGQIQRATSGASQGKSSVKVARRAADDELNRRKGGVWKTGDPNPGGRSGRITPAGGSGSTLRDAATAKAVAGRPASGKLVAPLSSGALGGTRRLGKSGTPLTGGLREHGTASPATSPRDEERYEAQQGRLYRNRTDTGLLASPHAAPSGEVEPEDGRRQNVNSRVLSSTARRSVAPSGQQTAAAARTTTAPRRSPVASPSGLGGGSSEQTSGGARGGGTRSSIQRGGATALRPRSGTLSTGRRGSFHSSGAAASEEVGDASHNLAQPHSETPSGLYRAGPTAAAERDAGGEEDGDGGMEGEREDEGGVEAHMGSEVPSSAAGHWELQMASIEERVQSIMLPRPERPTIADSVHVLRNAGLRLPDSGSLESASERELSELEAGMNEVIRAAYRELIDKQGKCMQLEAEYYRELRNLAGDRHGDDVEIVNLDYIESSRRILERKVEVSLEIGEDVWWLEKMISVQQELQFSLQRKSASSVKFYDHAAGSSSDPRRATPANGGSAHSHFQSTSETDSFQMERDQQQVQHQAALYGNVQQDYGASHAGADLDTRPQHQHIHHHQNSSNHHHIQQQHQHLQHVPPQQHHQPHYPVMNHQPYHHQPHHVGVGSSRLAAASGSSAVVGTPSTRRSVTTRRVIGGGSTRIVRTSAAATSTITSSPHHALHHGSSGGGGSSHHPQNAQPTYFGSGSAGQGGHGPGFLPRTAPLVTGAPVLRSRTMGVNQQPQ